MRKVKCTKFMYKLIVVLYSLLLLFLKFLRSTKDFDDHAILVILPKYGIGDMALRLNAMFNLVNILKEYNIYFAADSGHIRFLKALGIDLHSCFIELDLNIKTKFNSKIFRTNISRLNIKKWKYIVSFDLLDGYIFALLCGVHYKQIIYPEYEDFNSSQKIIIYFYKFILRNIKTLDFFYDKTQMLHRSFIAKETVKYVIKHCSGQEISDGEYVGCILPKPDKLFFTSKPYCVFCVGMSQVKELEGRGWPVERYAEVANHIVEKYKLQVCLCGDKEDVKKSERLIDLLKQKEYVSDYTGKTNFSEWIRLIGNAVFVIGNDSGYIHIATALKIQAFVIAGYWNYGRFLPYYKDTKETMCPIDIRISQPKCMLCHLKNKTTIEYQNCHNNLKKNGMFDCVSKITTQYVIDCIDANLEVDKSYSK